MKKHSFLLIAFIWCVAAAFNYCDEVSIVTVLYNIFAAISFLLLYIFQLTLNKRGEEGRIIFKRICIGYIALLGVILIFAVVYGILKFM